MLFAFSRDDGMPVASKALATVSPKYRTPVNAIWTATALCILYVLLAMSIKVGETSIYVIVVNSTLVFLFLSFTIPLIAALMAYGTAKWPNPGPWAMSAGLYKLVTLLSVIGMGVILFIAVAPPNERVLYVVLGFIALALVLWFAVENRRFEGPPTGERIEKRRAAIAAAEKAVGESV
jgi:amino acid transporter